MGWPGAAPAHLYMGTGWNTTSSFLSRGVGLSLESLKAGGLREVSDPVPSRYDLPLPQVLLGLESTSLFGGFPTSQRERDCGVGIPPAQDWLGNYQELSDKELRVLYWFMKTTSCINIIFLEQKSFFKKKLVAIFSWTVGGTGEINIICYPP